VAEIDEAGIRQLLQTPGATDGAWSIPGALPPNAAARSAAFGGASNHSISMVPGGFEVMSYITRLMPRTSLMIRVAVSPRKSWVKG